MMRERMRIAVIFVATAAPAAAPLVGDPVSTVSVDLKLRTGGAISGLVVEYDDHGLVVVRDRTPYVFAWTEIEPGKAYVAWRKIRVHERGGEGKLTAADHFGVGRFALQVGRNDLAADEFARARRLDRSFEPRIRGALAEFRERRRSTESGVSGGRVDKAAANPSVVADSGADRPDAEASVDAVDAALPEGEVGGFALSLPSASEGIDPARREDVRNRVMEAYRAFGAKVQEILGKGVVLVETEHFLIWTDWDARERSRLSEWAEAMYRAVGEQLALAPDADVFLAKCPIFCWKNKAGFRKFARSFDGYSGVDAVGYTRALEKSGHVHVVLVRQGGSPDDLDAFASTLVHEGTHAFLHRLHSTRLIPHWINEGFANAMTERVLGERCPNKENAALLARPFVRYDWPIGDFLRDSGPIGVEQYALAHSVVEFLLAQGSDRFAGFVRGLKDGQALPVALAAHFDGLSLEALESRWRDSIRRANPGLPGGEGATRPQVPSSNDR